MDNDNTLSHIDKDGNPTIVDISSKSITRRTAVACSLVVLDPKIAALLKEGEINTKKGPVFQTAIIAGTMAAKQTFNLIPLCHPIGLEDCRIKIYLDKDNIVHIQCKVVVNAKTGVEMEALTGASVAALTVYDMCKGVSHNIIIKEIRLFEKKGGKSDFTLSRITP